MQQLAKTRAFALAACCVAALALTAPASAQYGGVVVGGGYYGYGGWYGSYYPWGWGAPRPYWYGGSPYYVGYAAPTWGAAPASARKQPVAQAPSQLMVYPKNGQSEYQQATDRYECYRWAVSELGYDPTTAGSPTAPRDLTDYNRAQTACLTARGYSVK
jgi:hypothetical protein